MMLVTRSTAATPVVTVLYTIVQLMILFIIVQIYTKKIHILTILVEFGAHFYSTMMKSSSVITLHV